MIPKSRNQNGSMTAAQIDVDIKRAPVTNTYEIPVTKKRSRKSPLDLIRAQFKNPLIHVDIKTGAVPIDRVRQFRESERIEVLEG